jgi:hypothetical protein
MNNMDMKERVEYEVLKVKLSALEELLDPFGPGSARSSCNLKISQITEEVLPLYDRYEEIFSNYHKHERKIIGEPLLYKIELERATVLKMFDLSLKVTGPVQKATGELHEWF